MADAASPRPGDWRAFSLLGEAGIYLLKCRNIEALMKAQLGDTSPEAEEIILNHCSCASPAEKLERVLELNKAVMELAAARIRAEYGHHIAGRQLRLRLASLWIDRDTMIRAFGWDPEIEGY